MSKLYGTPHNITGFRKIAKAHRNDRTPQQMLDLHEQRADNRPGTPEPSLVRWIMRKHSDNVACPSNVRIIPLGSHTHQGIAACTDARKKNWRSPKATRCASDIITTDLGRYSSRCTYTHYEYTPVVESWGAVVGNHLYYRIDTANGIVCRTVKAPRGYRWDIDANGIRIMSLTDSRCDYHPTAKDLLNKIDLRLVARENLATRKQQEALAREQKKNEKRAIALISKAEREGATVCMRDSLRAGNCQAGSESWARRHGLDPKGHYAPSQLSEIANGDGLRVAIVIATAIRRHRVEMDRGFAELSDHRI